MAFNINYAGAWRSAKNIHIHYAGAWRQAKEIWVHQAGAWRRVYMALRAKLTGSSLYVYALMTNNQQAFAGVEVRLDANGAMSLWKYENTNHTSQTVPGGWLEQGTSAQFEVLATSVGDPIQGHAANQWLNLGQNRHWNLTVVAEDIHVKRLGCTLTLQIRPVGGNVVASAEYPLSVSAVSEY